jgi:hypothetical protein
MMKKDKFPFLKRVLAFLFLWNNLLAMLFVFIFSFILFTFNILEDSTSNFTWIYSASMQTLAALIALLPISFSFYLRKVDDQKYIQIYDAVYTDTTIVFNNAHDGFIHTYRVLAVENNEERNR